MRVFVVMSNDFPDCVFGSKPVAEAYCAKKMQEQVRPRSYLHPRIYYKVHEFVLNKEPSE